VHAHLEAFVLEAEPKCGLLDAVQDLGAELLVGNAEIHEAVHVALGDEGSANFGRAAR